MKLLILHALISDKSNKIYKELVSLFGVENMEKFYYNFIRNFPHLDLTELEELYKDDKDNVSGMIQDIYMMIVAGHVSYNDFILDCVSQIEEIRKND